MTRFKRRLPPPNWLRAFEAAARHLSFTLAAREMHVTQSAVSQQVRLLEQYLDEPLFVRHPRRLALTDTGSAYLVSVHEAFEKLSQSTDELFGRRSGERLSVHSGISFAACFLAPRLASFQACHPDIDLRLSMSVWQAETVWDAVSLEIRHGNGAWPGLRVDRLTHDRLTPLVAPVLMTGGNRLSEPADIARHRWIRVLGNGSDWERWLRAAGLPDIEPAEEVQCDNSVMAMEYAAAGGGIALGTSSLQDPMVETRRLVAPFTIQCEATQAFYLASPETRPDTPAAAHFRSWLLSLADRP
jgi:LysR family glycine cleavage system transcriptional activator